MRKFLLLLLCLSVVGSQPILAGAAETGTNTIRGHGAITRNGRSVTCAGNPVFLVRGSLPLDSGYVDKWESDIGKASNVLTVAACGRAGQFLFSRVPDGDYWIQSSVRWSEEENSPSGVTDTLASAELLQRLSVRGGQVKALVLTDIPN